LYLTMRTYSVSDDPDIEPYRRYAFELNLWFVIYGIVLAASIATMRAMPVSALRALIGLLPMIPLFGVLNLIMRKYRTIDELERKIVAEGIMFAFGATAIITLTYGFLQVSIKAPALSYFFVWPILAACWVAGGFFARRRYS
ncbi:MAG TPA: hypothetical protein VGD50_00795, partial [Candidatus Baltobacteraceae bacterium]